MSAPRVSLLPPRPGLDNAHHGPASASGIKLFDTPTQFHNPWKSFRMAGPTDIWSAYQKGAAVAPACCSPNPTTGRNSPSNGNSNGNNGNNGGSGNNGGNGNRAAPNAEASKSEATLVDTGSASGPGNAAAGTGKDNGAQDGTEDAAAKLANLDVGDDYDDDNGDNGEDEGKTYAEECEEECGDKLNSQHPSEEITCYIRPELKDMAADDDADDWREPPLRVVKPAWAPCAAPAITWLGHASVLLRIPWTNAPSADPVCSQPPADMCSILFDPIFSQRCSPVQSFGPARYLDPPCGVDELPPIHAVLISHDHYDHLDYNTILDIWAFHHRTVHFFVPLGLGKWFHYYSGVPANRVTELDWWHETLVSFTSTPGSPDGEEQVEESPESALAEGGRDDDMPGTYGGGAQSGNGAKSREHQHPPRQPAAGPIGAPEVDANAKVNESASLNLKIVLTPAQHRSGRGLFDQMTTLWGSWVVGVISPEQKTPDPLEAGMHDWRGFKAYFGGDTGYRYAGAENDPEAICPAFKEIAELYGPFDLAMLPLSTGSSLPFLRKTLNISLDQYTMTSSMHCSPEDSVELHKLLPAKRSFGIHWGTFSDGPETRASRVTFGRARRQAGLSKRWPERNSFVIADIGETLVYPKDEEKK